MEILFVDDEPYFAGKYVDELRKSHSIHFLNRASEVIPFLEENTSVDCVVLDIMMPGGGLHAAGDSALGLDTGLLLLEEMRNLGRWPFPVVILTNRKPKAILAEISQKRIPMHLIPVHQKIHTSPNEFDLILEGHVKNFRP